MCTAMRLALALVVCTCAHAVATAQAADAASRRLSIHWADPEKQFPHETEELVAEARALFAPMGIELLWAASGSVATRDTVQVVLERDDAPREVEVPVALANALVKAKVATAWDALSYSCKKEYCAWVADAKKDDTRARRIEKAVGMIREGKKLKA